jgi:uncharacterized protein YraI
MSALLFAPAGPAAAESSVTFTLNVPSAFARSAPTTEAARSASLFQGETYTINARLADSSWLRIDYTGARGEAWVAAYLGAVTGDITAVPVVDPAQAGSPTLTYAPDAYYPASEPVIPLVTPAARDIYLRGQQQGNNPRHFSKIGDCQSIPAYFLGAFDYGPKAYSLGPYAALSETVDNFAGSFARDSVAASPGFNVASVWVPLWSDPKRCLVNESPVECEFRLWRPSYALITMETWWNGSPGGYEKYLRRIIEFSIAHGAVPILATKADNYEGDGSLNRVIVSLAHEYGVPLWNFWAAAQPLPAHGLTSDGFHLTYERPYFDDPARMEKAWPWRNLTALQALDAVWRGVR